MDILIGGEEEPEYMYIEILDLSHAIGYLNHIKYTSQRTGCELTTVYSSGPFIGGEEEPEYI